MAIYPTELSQELEDMIDKDQLDLALTLDEVDPENCYIKAIGALENNQRAMALKLFKKTVDSFGKDDEFENPFKLAAQAELLLMTPGDYSKQNDLLKSLAKKTSEIGEQRLLARLFHGLALVMQWRRNSAQTIKYLLQSQSIYQSIEEHHGLCRILDTLGTTYAAIADHEQALLFYSESLALKIVIQDHQGQALTLGNLARLCLQLGRYQQARNFVEMDIALCENETDEIKARLLNLRARIELAEQQWDNADKFLSLAIDLLANSRCDSLFFCLKDQLLLELRKEVGEQLDAKASRLKKLLPKNSLYHQVHYQFAYNQYLHSNNKLDFSTAEKLTDDIIELDLPEVEIEYRLWLVEIARSETLEAQAQQQLLLARKLARMTGFKRFIAQINSLMIEMQVSEKIDEESIRPISENSIEVEDGYLIRKKLGSGGFGDVYLAHDMVHNRDIALKVFQQSDQLDHHQQQKRWNQARLEFEAVAKLSHPSIAQIYAIGHDTMGNPYLVQQFISGGDLNPVMQSNKELRSALTYLIPIARALAAIHSVGVIHRDVKPDNILINQQGLTVLVDFGIALLKSSGDEQSILGTENYIAPEQRLSADINFKADLFSLGCIFYEWLSGEKVSIQSKKSNKLTAWLGIKKNAEVSTIDEDVCGEAYPLIQSLLAYSPEERPENATEVAEAMSKILESL
jgi:hypothetical protein